MDIRNDRFQGWHDGADDEGRLVYSVHGPHALIAALQYARDKVRVGDVCLVMACGGLRFLRVDARRNDHHWRDLDAPYIY